MAHYHLEHLDLSIRQELAVQMLAPNRPWGRVTRLARSLGTSRKFLYQLRDRAEQAIWQSLMARAPGRKALSQTISVDRPFLQRSLVTLSLLPPSLRNLQLALEVLFGQHCSLGFIQQTLQRAGERAQVANRNLQPAELILGEIDEIFKCHRPCLTVVDGHSLLVLNLVPQSDSDRTTWGVTLLDLFSQGIRFEDLVSDASQSLQAGVRDAQMSCVLRPDLFHLYRQAHEITHKLEWRAYQALALAERAQHAEQVAQAPSRHRGRPLKVSLPFPQAASAADQAMRDHDLWVWLFSELRQTLQICTPQGRLTASAQARQELRLIVEWMQSLQIAKVTPLANHLAELVDPLLAPLEALEQRLAEARQDLSPENEAFLLWAWTHRQALELEIERDLPKTLQPAAFAFWTALAHFHRTSSLAEALHSWLRPFLELHRGMPEWLFPLLQAFWNHHSFQRGKRSGQSPLALSGCEDGLSLSQWIHQLLAPAAIDISNSIFKVPEKCNPIYHSI